MILFADTVPSPASNELVAMYCNLPQEGMVHSSMMCGERYEMSAAFDPAWSCAAVSWSGGGYETYRFADGPTIKVGPVGAITLAPGVRYAYSAWDARPFRGNTVVFPRWIVDDFGINCLDTNHRQHQHRDLKTRRFHPGRTTLNSMNRIAALCRCGEQDDAVYEEELALLYARLITEQLLGETMCLRLPSVKRATRMELGRRVDRARYHILERFSDAELSLDEIARHACLSKYHLIRTFRACSGCTPMQFLTRVRTDAAHELIRTSSMPIGDIVAAVGYRNRAAFFRAFRNRYGAAPSTIRP